MGEGFFMSRLSLSLPRVRGPVLENALVSPQELTSDCVPITAVKRAGDRIFEHHAWRCPLRAFLSAIFVTVLTAFRRGYGSTLMTLSLWTRRSLRTNGKYSSSPQ